MPLPLLRGTTEYADCASCPFSRDGRPNNPVLAEFPSDPAFLLVGEWPGRNEVVFRRPMVGETGQTVVKVLSSVGKTRDQVLISNSILCLPTTDNPNVREQAARACNARLKMELRQFPGKPILTMGNTAARAIIPQSAFDAIDSPETKPSHKKKQKERQKSIDKALAAKAKRRETIAEKLIRKYLKQWNPKAKRELVLKFEPEVLKAIEKRAYREAEEELERLELQRQAKAAATPKKRKTIGISAIAGTCFSEDIDGTGKRLIIPTINLAAIQRGGGKALLGAHTPDLAIWNVIADVAKINAHALGKNIFLSFPGEIEFEDSERAAKLFYKFYKLAVAEGSFALDTETYVEDSERHNALQAYKARIRAIGFATKDWGISVLWDLLPPWCLTLLKALLISANVRVIFHNGLYDRTVLRANGFICAESYEDCYIDSATEFLTELGWRKYKQIEKGTRLATVNVEGVLEFQHFSERLSKPYQGLALVVETKHTRAVVTPNHRMWCRPVRRTAKSWHGTPLGPWEFRRAEDLLHAETDTFNILQACRPADDGILEDLNQIRLLGLWVSDGSLGWYNDKPYYLDISQVPDGIAVPLLTRLAETYDLRVGRSVHMEPWRKEPCVENHWRLYDVELANNFLAWCGRYSCERHLPEGAFEWPTTRKLAFFEGLFAGDGTCEGGITDRFVYRTASTRLADDVQALALSVGWTATKPTEPTEDGIWHVFILRNVPCETQVRARVGGRNASIKELVVDDRIVCFSVPNETLITRSGSRPAFYGNSLLKHHAAFPGAAHNLQSVTAQFYGVTPWKSEFRNNEETPEKLTRYNVRDTIATRKIDVALTVWVKRTATERAYESDKRMAACASRMHLDGVPVSREENSVLLKQFLIARDEAREKLHEAVHDKEVMDRIWDNLAMEQAKKQRLKDSESFRDRQTKRLDEIKTQSAKGKWAWKISANQHIAALLRALDVHLTAVTDKGATKVNKEILEGLVEVPIVRDILRFRENDKLISTFVWPLFDRTMKDGTPFYGFADERDRVHPIWSIHKITGRWASGDPIVSNIPKAKYKKLADGSKQILRPNIRRQYVAPVGRVLVGFDFRQLEAKILALLSGDPWLCHVFTHTDAFGKPLDIHREAARIIWPEFDALEEYQQKQLRERAKPFEYGAFYGADPETLYKQLLKEGMNVTRADVYKAHATLMAKLSGVVRYQANAFAMASQPPFTLTSLLLGRKRIFPMGQVDASECKNWPCQSEAADIMNTGMSRMMEKLLSYHNAFPILQIHDAAVFECWEDDAEELLLDVVDRFTQECTNPLNSVTIKFDVDAKISKSWADL